jgi:hypothetical protein
LSAISANIWVMVAFSYFHWLQGATLFDPAFENANLIVIFLGFLLLVCSSNNPRKFRVLSSSPDFKSLLPGYLVS